MHDTPERWARLPNFPAYFVSTHGRVRREGRILKPHVNERGYYRVCLCAGPLKRFFYLQRLVLMAHVGLPPFEGAQACHLNGNRLDNRLENLMWGDQSENESHKKNPPVDGLDVVVDGVPF